MLKPSATPGPRPTPKIPSIPRPRFSAHKALSLVNTCLDLEQRYPSSKRNLPTALIRSILVRLSPSSLLYRWPCSKWGLIGGLTAAPPFP
jgi:hypothetical protein